MTPIVSIIVTAYNPIAKPYLDLCIKSIRNLDYPKEALSVIVVGGPDYLPRYDNVITGRPSLEEWYPPIGLNYGISMSNPDSKYYFLLNDDVILTKNSLANLVELYENTPSAGIAMPFGNDTQNLPIGIGPIPPGPYKHEDIAPHIDQLINIDSNYKNTVLVTDLLCLYAVLISKDAFLKIGPFDETLIGMDDTDYSMRSSLAGYSNVVSYDSLVFHAGGASTSGTWTDELRKKSKALFEAKWNKKC